MTRNFCLMLIGILFLTPFAFANEHLSTRSTSALRPTQAEVLRKIHLVNQTEIKAGQLAKEKGQSESVRSYGNRLVEDHTKADEKVRRTAQAVKVDMDSRIIAIDDKMEPMERELMTKLQSVNGTEFDRTFAREMDVAHTDTIKYLEEAKAELKGTRVAALIDELLPTLHKHEGTAAGLSKTAE